MQAYKYIYPAYPVWPTPRPQIITDYPPLYRQRLTATAKAFIGAALQFHTKGAGRGYALRQFESFHISMVGTSRLSLSPIDHCHSPCTLFVHSEPPLTLCTDSVYRLITVVSGVADETVYSLHKGIYEASG